MEEWRFRKACSLDESIVWAIESERLSMASYIEPRKFMEMILSECPSTYQFKALGAPVEYSVFYDHAFLTHQIVFQCTCPACSMLWRVQFESRSLAYLLQSPHGRELRFFRDSVEKRIQHLWESLSDHFLHCPEALKIFRFFGERSMCNYPDWGFRSLASAKPSRSSNQTMVQMFEANRKREKVKKQSEKVSNRYKKVIRHIKF